MLFDSFDDLYEHLQGQFQDEQYASVLELAGEAVERYPEQRPLLDYSRLAAAARLGQTDLVLQVLHKALADGIWYSEILLRRIPSFQPLQGNPEFEKLILLNQQVAEKDQERTFPLLTLRSQGRCQADGEACPLLIGLHANASVPHHSIGFWKPAASAGWLVAAPQSSQALWKDAYVWDDREIAEREVQKVYKTLCKTYACDLDKTILAGHSMGGEIAIWMALRSSIPLRGFLAIGPGGPFIDNLQEWEPLLPEDLSTNLRGYIIIGEKDRSIPQANIPRLVEKLNMAGISCQLDIIPGAEHNFTTAYEPAILNALQFLA